MICEPLSREIKKSFFNRQLSSLSPQYLLKTRLAADRSIFCSRLYLSVAMQDLRILFMWLFHVRYWWKLFTISCVFAIWGVENNISLVFWEFKCRLLSPEHIPKLVISSCNDLMVVSRLKALCCVVVSYNQRIEGNRLARCD